MRLKKHLTELSMSADTDIKYKKNTSSSIDAHIILKDLVVFRFFADYGSLALMYKILQKYPKLLDKLEKKKQVEYTKRQGRYIDPNSDQSKKGWVFTWEVWFEDESGDTALSPKRKGAAIELFSALEEVMKNFITEKKPVLFHFAADVTEPSRVKLYKLLAKKILKISSYKLITVDFKNAADKSTYFIFHKL